MAGRYLNLREIAEALEVSLSWLRRRLPDLEQKHGFPPALGGMGTRRLAAAVEAWRDTGALVELRTRETPVTDLRLWREELDRRADQLSELDHRTAAVETRFGPDVLRLRLVRETRR